MKISKLFHWLYALLMLLPFMFFVPSVLYYAFNDNATMQTVEVPKTETISVDFNQIVINGNFDDNSNWSIGRESAFASLSIDDNVAKVTWTQEFNNGRNNGLVHTPYDFIGTHQYFVNFNLTMNVTSSLGNVYFIGGSYATTVLESTYTGGLSFPFNNSLTNYSVQAIYKPSFSTNRELALWTDGSARPNVGDYIEVSNFWITDLTKMYGEGNEPTLTQFNNTFGGNYKEYTLSQPMQITYDTGETEELVENTSIINYAWESIWDLPLFSWTKVTFVSVPFAYITGLFGIGVNSSLNYVFGYFVTISICWLVFDILMYVPLLVHRWIDKARLE